MPRKTSSENDLIISTGGAAPRRHTVASPRAKRTTKAAEGSPSADAITPAELQVSFEPTQEDIAALAFSYWEARGCQGGSPEEDWLRAEEHLRSLYAQRSAATA
jgi:hypothetical protein